MSRGEDNHGLAGEQDSTTTSERIVRPQQGNLETHEEDYIDVGKCPNLPGNLIFFNHLTINNSVWCCQIGRISAQNTTVDWILQSSFIKNMLASSGDLW